MTGLIMAGQLILGLSILVILHEFGHFITAKAFGIKVEKFFLFFDAWGIKLFKFKKGDTEYGIGWLPLGGYVKIAGMIDESMDKEQMKKPAEPWEFRSKPAWQRLIVMIAGVTVNAILGILIFTFLLYHYEQYLPNKQLQNDGIYAYKLAKDIGFQSGDKIYSIDGKEVTRFKDVKSTNVILGSTVTVNRNNSFIDITIPDNFYTNFKKSNKLFIEPLNFSFYIDSVIKNLPAAKSGIIKGDKILNIDNTQITSWGQFTEIISSEKGEKVNMDVLRNNDTLNLNLTIDTSGVIGIYRSPMPYNPLNYSFSQALKFGYKDAYDLLAANIKGFGKIIKGEEKASESIQGPIGIATIYGGNWDWHRFWFITGLLSLILAFMNILPIPALDGGHVVFLAIEAVTRKKIPIKVMEYAQIAGMVILLALMVFAFGNDIFRLLK